MKTITLISSSERIPAPENRQKPVPGNKGFTLIEFTIVVAITGILATMALPSYQRSVLAADRAEGQILLLQVASTQEQFYSENNRYSANADPFLNPVAVTRISASGLYQISVEACGAGIETCFVATATPQGRQRADTCTTLTITNIGLKGATGGSVYECWR